MSSTRLSRTARDTERLAERAWDELLSLAGTTGAAARGASRRTADLVDGAGSWVGGAAEEARYRALAARDALAGRRPPLPWRLIAVAAVAGATAGWLAAMARRRAEQVYATEFPEELAELPAVTEPSYLSPEPSTNGAVRATEG